MSNETTIRRPPPAARRAPVPTLRLLFHGGRVAGGERWPLPAGVTRIGRNVSGPDAISLPGDRTLSRAHATIERRGVALTLRDDGSANGTSREGVRVDEAPLADGDLVRLGDVFLLVRCEPPDLQDWPIEGLVGGSPAMMALRDALSRFGESEAKVLLLGESGTGKGVCARALHALSDRGGPLISINCAAIPLALAESALFGHRAGAFTGATADSEGYFRAAHGGTLFIDEIGDLPPALQPKLLHALEAGEIIPVGATRPEPCDVRVVAATSLYLVEAVRAGHFRGDLYARVAELVLPVPPLRARREDVLPLMARALGPDAPPLSPELVARLLAYRWPFNVRELEKIATELAIRGAGRERLEPELIEARLQAFEAPAPAPAPEPPAPATPRGPPDREALEEALRAHRGVVSDVARATGRSRKQVYRWLTKYGLDPEDYRDPLR